MIAANMSRRYCRSQPLAKNRKNQRSNSKEGGPNQNDLFFRTDQKNHMVRGNSNKLRRRIISEREKWGRRRCRNTRKIHLMILLPMK